MDSKLVDYLEAVIVKLQLNSYSDEEKEDLLSTLQLYVSSADIEDMNVTNTENSKEITKYLFAGWWHYNKPRSRTSST